MAPGFPGSEKIPIREKYLFFYGQKPPTDSKILLPVRMDCGSFEVGYGDQGDLQFSKWNADKSAFQY